MRINETDTVYISGKMRGMKDLNFPKFNAVEKLLKDKYHCKVLNPALTELDLSFEQYLEIDLAMVRVSTVIVLIDFWWNSFGAITELMLALDLDKRIVLLEDINND